MIEMTMEKRKKLDDLKYKRLPMKNHENRIAFNSIVNSIRALRNEYGITALMQGIMNLERGISNFTCNCSHEEGCNNEVEEAKCD